MVKSAHKGQALYTSVFRHLKIFSENRNKRWDSWKECFQLTSLSSTAIEQLVLVSEAISTRDAQRPLPFAVTCRSELEENFPAEQLASAKGHHEIVAALSP